MTQTNVRDIARSWLQSPPPAATPEDLRRVALSYLSCLEAAKADKKRKPGAGTIVVLWEQDGPEFMRMVLPIPHLEDAEMMEEAAQFVARLNKAMAALAEGAE